MIITTPDKFKAVLRWKDKSKTKAVWIKYDPLKHKDEKPVIVSYYGR